MPRVPAVNGAKLIKILLKKGFVLNRVSGSHHILINPTKQITISVPVHKGKTLGKGITLAIIKDSQITIEEFLKLL
ncbi:type II toxin-antitoxin system HicA family toxin [Patescibacteria group bacterium]|nr:type II toxin-antitoxin system HicA family toxin [Patescibacteria group bacterium]